MVLCFAAFVTVFVVVITKSSLSVEKCHEDYSLGIVRSLVFHYEMTNYWKTESICAKGNGSVFKMVTEDDHNILLTTYEHQLKEKQDTVWIEKARPESTWASWAEDE